MDEFEQGLTNASNKFSDFSKNIENAGKKVSDIGSALTTKVTLPVGGLAVAATKMSMDFEGAMAKVATIADTTAVPIDSLQSAIIGLSNETGVAAGDVANSVYNVISATGDTAGAVGLVSNATKLATAGFTDSESALSVLTTAINAYGLSSEKAAKISDSLIMTQNLGVTTVADLASNMGRAIATASAYGVGLENVEAGYVALTKGGISTAESTTYLSSMMNELGKAGGDVSKILQEQTGMSFGQLMASGMSLGDVLGILYESTGRNSEGFINLWSSAEAGKAANAIVNQGLEEFNANLQTISGSMGATQTAYDTMQTSSFNLGKAFNELKNAAIQFGDILMPVLVPALTAVVQKATELVQWFTSLDSGTQNLILTIGGIVVAAGPVLTVVGNIISAIGKIGGAINTVISVGSKLMGGIKALFALIAANPVVAIVTGIIAAVVLLYTKCEWFRDAVHAVIDAVVGFFKGAWDLIVSVWNAAGEFFGGIVEGIKGVFEGIGEFLGGLFSKAWGAVKTAWGAAKEFFGDLWSSVKEKASDAASWIGDKLKGAWDGIKTAWDGAKSFFGGIFGNIMDKGREAAENVGNKLASAYNYVKEHWDEATPYFDGLWGNIKNVFGDAWEVFKNIGGNIVNGIKDGIASMWGSFTGWVKEKFDSFVGGVKNLLGIHSPSTEFAEIGRYVIDGMTEGMDSKDSALSEQATATINALMGAFGGMSKMFASIGVNAMEALSGSLGGAIQSLQNRVSSLMSSIASAAKAALGIHSPSRVFAGIGENMALGLAEGWDDEYNGIKRKIESGLNFGTATVGVSANARYGAQEAAGRPGSGWGNTYVTINSPVAVDGVQVAREWQKTTQRMAISYV